MTDSSSLSTGLPSGGHGDSTEEFDVDASDAHLNKNIDQQQQQNQQQLKDSTAMQTVPSTSTCDENGLRDPLFPAWTRLTQAVHRLLAHMVTVCALSAVRNPKSYIGIITVSAITLQLAGFFTNFILVLDLEQIFTPVGSRPLQHYQWIKSSEGFPNEVRTIQMIFHADGSNVLAATNQTRRVLEAVDLITSTPGYDDLCAQGEYVNFANDKTCRITSVSGYWENHSLEAFDADMMAANNNGTYLRQVISNKTMASGAPVFHDVIVGNYMRDPVTNLITTAQSLLVQLELPETPGTNDFEANMLDRLTSMRDQWAGDDKQRENQANATDPIQVDIMTMYSFQLELIRAILEDLWLIPLSIILMIGFTCAVFYRRGQPVQSRCMLGLASVITICMSVMTGNGIMFLIGVPYSAIHQMLPFVIFGIGLDDTFIITAAYFRNTHFHSTEDRVRTTMLEVGPSICLTTITTVFAFTLGYITSSLPGVHWLCLYAMITIGIDFFYQITYFISFLALDEQRIVQGRKDCCFWITIDNGSSNSEEKIESGIKPALVSDESRQVSAEVWLPRDDEGIYDEMLESEEEETRVKESSDSFAPPVNPTTASNVTGSHIESDQDSMGFPVQMMRWYSNFLLKPFVRVAVIIAFVVLFGLCCYSATLLKQEFNMVEYVPDDSYLRNTYSSLDKYSSVVRPIGVYFRNINQMDEEMQRQMIDYVNDLEMLDQIGGPSNISLSEPATPDGMRPFCWIRDIREIEKGIDDPIISSAVANLTFSEKLEFALSGKIFREVYGQDIIRDDSGVVTASRCILFLKNLDLQSVEAQIEMLLDQRNVTKAQPINQTPEHRAEWAFFSFEKMFFYWEAYAVAVDELVFTMISGVVAVTFISFLFIPHWTSVLFVLPSITVLYIDLLGVIRFFGLQINGLTYICVVVSIGLLVDFLMHILLRYYESSPQKSREERVKETLQTIGVSISIGGFTTLLGVIPLALSSMKMFLTVFYSFFAMVALGCCHGIILLPVILSYVGPTTAVRGHHLAPPPDSDISDSFETKKVKEIPPAKVTKFEVVDRESIWHLAVSIDVEC